MSEPFSFRLAATDGAARTGAISTAHGVVHTPAFMPVGTQASVKGVHHDDVRASGAEIVLGNTYHLMLRPSAERIAVLGGLHAFMRWPDPILTDSGGFQVMSLSPLRKISEKGVTFRSHIDGATIELSPERAVEVQNLLGSDIVMQLDECVRRQVLRRNVVGVPVVVDVEQVRHSVALGRSHQRRLMAPSERVLAGDGVGLDRHIRVAVDPGDQAVDAAVKRCPHPAADHAVVLAVIDDVDGAVARAEPAPNPIGVTEHEPLLVAPVLHGPQRARGDNPFGLVLLEWRGIDRCGDGVGASDRLG